MITEIKHTRMPDKTRLSEFRGLSTDTKPTENVCNGSTFYEMDSKDTYYYDGDGKTWEKEGGA